VPAALTGSGWSLVAIEADPHAAHAGGRVGCGPQALRTELGGIEVSTESCNYATLVHPTLVEAPAGSHVEGEISWLSLVGLEEAVATVSLSLGDQTLWSREVAIPSGAELHRLSLAVDRPWAAGTPVYFHVRNHGYNAWIVSRLTLVPPERQ
jgi:hypothetical protein